MTTEDTLIPQVGTAAAPITGPLTVQSVLWRVRVVIPAFGRCADVQALLSDLAREGASEQGRCRLNVLVVDNASDPPLEDAVEVPDELDVQFLRLAQNAGGSGGFNAGMGYFLDRGIAGDACELLWLLDSDVRLTEGSLAPLLRALEADKDVGIVGSALISPVGGEVFELGGRVDPRTGEYDQTLPAGWEGRPVIPADYIAACSMLIRRTVAERAGLMADVFLNGDDVEWVYRARRITGCGVGVATASRVIHPRPDRARTLARYYAARNAFRAIDEAARPTPATPGFDATRARWSRAKREVSRALAMTMVGRADLGTLHIRGLCDAAAGRDAGPGDTLSCDAGERLELLPDALRGALSSGRGRVLVRPGVLTEPAPVMRMLNSLCVEPQVTEGESPGNAAAALAALKRLVIGPEYGTAIVPARGHGRDWLIARTMVTVADGKFVIRRWMRAEMALQLLRAGTRGLAAARRVRRGRAIRATPRPLRSGPAPTLSVVILSYNRWEKLRETLAAIRRDPSMASAEVIIADNGSSDGTPQRIREEFPQVRLIPMDGNRGVVAFNEGVKCATGEAVLILDDDAIPAPGAVDAALNALARRADIGAVALHPHHPISGQSEWPFASKIGANSDRWPVMGCANLVRRDAWERVGGYESAFFLYRNDTDLALKLLSAGYGVYFDPALRALHDSPAAAAKSVRWFHLATRNWVWMCRRHGRSTERVVGVLLGWMWAHRLAGRSAARHAAALRGLAGGVLSAPPPLPGTSRDFTLRELLALRLKRRAE